jgi:hypothetical protein
MSISRRTASRLLHFIVRHSPEPSRSWAGAMLREMDFMDDDWAALVWALGSATAICRLSLIQRLKGWQHGAGRAARPTRTRRILTALSGMTAAVVILGTCAMTLAALTRASWFEPGQEKLAGQLLVVAIPATVYLLGGVMLMARKRRVVSGILAAGATLVAHSLLYLTTHG